MITQYKIKKGNQSDLFGFNKPIYLGNVKELNYVIGIDPIIKNLDSANWAVIWNQLIGIQFGILPPFLNDVFSNPKHDNSASLAWRYHSDKKRLELAPFICKNGFYSNWEHNRFENQYWKLIQLSDTFTFRVKIIIDYDFCFKINEISFFVNDIHSGTISYPGKMFKWGWIKPPRFEGLNIAPTDLEIVVVKLPKGV